MFAGPMILYLSGFSLVSGSISAFKISTVGGAESGFGGASAAKVGEKRLAEAKIITLTAKKFVMVCSMAGDFGFFTYAQPSNLLNDSGHTLLMEQGAI